jgi:hypothetical protein
VPPWVLSALGIGFIGIGWVCFVSALWGAKWSPGVPVWWTVFPLAVASLLFMAFEGGGAVLLYLAREIRRAVQIVGDAELRARVVATALSEPDQCER